MRQLASALAWGHCIARSAWSRDKRSVRRWRADRAVAEHVHSCADLAVRRQDMCAALLADKLGADALVILTDGGGGARPGPKTPRPALGPRLGAGPGRRLVFCTYLVHIYCIFVYIYLDTF